MLLNSKQQSPCTVCILFKKELTDSGAGTSNNESERCSAHIRIHNSHKNHRVALFSNSLLGLVILLLGLLHPQDVNEEPNQKTNMMFVGVG